MTAGTVACEAGSMARAIYDAMNAEFGEVEDDPGPPLDNRDTDRRRSCAVMAGAIVGYIKAHADVVVTTSDGALQTYDGDDTGPPAADRTLAGAVN